MLLLLKRGKFADRRCHEFVQKRLKSFSFGEPSSPARIRAGNAIQDVIEGDFGTFGIALLTAFNQPLGAFIGWRESRLSFGAHPVGVVEE